MGRTWEALLESWGGDLWGLSCPLLPLPLPLPPTPVFASVSYLPTLRAEQLSLLFLSVMERMPTPPDPRPISLVKPRDKFETVLITTPPKDRPSLGQGPQFLVRRAVQSRILRACLYPLQICWGRAFRERGQLLHRQPESQGHGE